MNAGASTGRITELHGSVEPQVNDGHVTDRLDSRRGPGIWLSVATNDGSHHKAA